MKLKEVFEKSIQFFKDKKIETPRLDAELLIAHALKIDRVQIYVKYEQPLSETEMTACREAIRRRSQGEPVAYITEEKGFFGEIFYVGSGVLIPRPETELIVEEALKYINLNKIKKPRVLDLGAGTGCIGFSILKNCEAATLVSLEKSEKAFEYLKKNLESFKLSNRTELFLADVEEFDFLKLGLFDIVVSNPPYIDQSDVETEENVKKFEPAEALFAKQEGYSCLKSWSQKTSKILQLPGIMLFEIGYKQGDNLKVHFQSLNIFSNVQIIKDLSGLDRIIKSVR